jgi:starvation-inducible DNA-binding protein
MAAAVEELKHMLPTHNDLPLEVRTNAVAILNARLADSIDLMLAAKQAHWNVKGPNFLALHKLFDEIVDASAEFVDLVAERAVQLGGMAEGTTKVAATQSSLKDYPLSITSERDHIEATSTALATFGARVRHAIDECDVMGDKDTADIFTEISRTTDKYLWFVEAHSPGSDANGRSRLRGQRADSHSVGG